MKCIWLIGRSGAGKTTLADQLEFHYRYSYSIMLDADKIRKTINADLTFSKEDRDENHRRIALLAQLMMNVGRLPIITTIAPDPSQRKIIRDILKDSVYIVYVDCPLKECIKRDPKGLYAKAKKGALKGFLDYPFSAPSSTEVDISIDSTLPLKKALDTLLDSIFTLRINRI